MRLNSCRKTLKFEWNVNLFPPDDLPPEDVPDDDNPEDDGSGEEPEVARSDIMRVSIEDEMRTSYLDYAMSVIVSRALPDVRDGLKPVHRRIRDAMNEGGYYYNRPIRKSARVVGEVIGKYHPHFYKSINDYMVRIYIL